MSFLKKIFGPKQSNPTSLIIHDHFLEVAQIEVVGSGAPRLLGIHRIELDGGIVQRGEIVRESEFQAALQNLFTGAMPSVIQPDHLFINIPFEQLYSFIKVFPSHTSADHMKIGIKEVVQNQSPFEFGDVEVDYSKRTNKKSVYCGALAYPKRWKHLVTEACSELGFKDLHFVAEPIAQTSYLGPERATNFALISWQETEIVLSLILGGLLYDSYLLRERFEENNDGAFIFDAIVQSEKNLKETFKATIDHLIFANFPQHFRKNIQTLAEKTGKKLVYLKEGDSPVASLIDMEQYSTSLVGLANYSLNPETEKHKM